LLRSGGFNRGFGLVDGDLLAKYVAALDELFTLAVGVLGTENIYHDPLGHL